MRISRAIAILAVVAAALPLAGETRANPSWEKLKSLVGTWDGHEGSQPVSITYTLVSNGTSLMESLNGAHDMNMITMYAPDGDTIVATHYCAMGNQPRMRAKPGANPNTLDFQFVDATNLQDPKGDVMRGLVVTFQDANHFQQTWTARAGGKDQTSDFVYTRKK